MGTQASRFHSLHSLHMTPENDQKRHLGICCGDGDCGDIVYCTCVYPAMLYNLLPNFAIDVNHGGESTMHIQ